MAEYPLDFASRQIKRVFFRAVGKSIPKILTELVTNADDSYRRLEHGGGLKEDPAPITIVFHREKRRLSVVDHAEGLTDLEMRERFVTYGKESTDQTSGFRTRSLFGKGLRDVLFTQHKGQVKSIKNGLFYNCQFKWKQVDGQERPFVDIKAPARVTPELRKALQIPINGTVVEFELADAVRTPHTEKLYRELSQFYMLRMVNSSPHREIKLHIVGRGKKGVDERNVTYVFPAVQKHVDLDHELHTATGQTVRVTGEIGLTPSELSQGEVGYVEREGGLLVLDEDDNVLDLQLFGFDEDPAARRISGIVRLDGGGAYIRERLNAKEPEEVLSETRDGFDRTHEFYYQIRDALRPQLQSIVSDLRKQGPQPKVGLSERTAERHRQALSLLNKIAKEMLGAEGRVPVIDVVGRTPPPEGIAFANSRVTIQSGIATPIAVLINTAMVAAHDEIVIISDNPQILVSPGRLRDPIHDGRDRIVVRMVHVSATKPNESGVVVALWKNVEVRMTVQTTDREVIHPVDGIEFDRGAYNVRLGARRTLKLFVDVEKVPIGSRICVACDGPGIAVATPIVVVNSEDVVAGTVAQTSVSLRGEGLIDEAIVTASVDSFIAGTKVSVVNREKPEREKRGLFGEYSFVPLERKVQSFYSPDGTILINTLDPVNASYFGSEPYEALESNTHCQVRLADLVLNECLWIMVSRALETGRLDRRFPDNPEIDVRTYVDEKKYEIGPQVHGLFVKGK